ncbi:MAG: FliM/FliN family flagellar motor switch protein [Proteobacteria bacterium]|nr:FliM/FliN family flagellar motor switch protein [Pseudomonadota bacterium]
MSGCYDGAIVIRPFPFSALPHVSRADAATARALRLHLGDQSSAAWRRWAERLLGAVPGTATLRLKSVHPRCPPQLLPRLQRGVALRISDPSAGQVVIVLDAGLAAQLVRALLRAGSEVALAPPTPMQHGLLAFALGWLLADVGAASCWTVEEAAPSLDASVQQGDRLVECLLTVGAQQGLLWLLAAPRTFTALPLAPVDQRAGSARFGDLHWSAALELARFSLPAGALERLGSDDIIVSPALRLIARDAPMALRLRVGRGSYGVSWDTDHLAITSAYQRELRCAAGASADGVDSRPAVGLVGRSPDRAEGGAEDGTATVPLRLMRHDRSIDGKRRARGVRPMSDRVELERHVIDELEVELVVELGRVELSLAELSRLGVGDVIALGQPLGGAVQVWAGGRRIGRAELVDVDGEVGARLVEVFS